MEQVKRRHGCLAAWLVLIIIANSASALIYLLGKGAVMEQLPGAPAWMFPALIILSLVNLVCAIALLKWKMWGFWGFLVSSILVLIVNLSSGIGIASSLGGLLGVAILYGVLHIGGDNKGWPQLD
jgi:hypothetical protein